MTSLNPSHHFQRLKNSRPIKKLKQIKVLRDINLKISRKPKTIKPKIILSPAAQSCIHALENTITLLKKNHLPAWHEALLSGSTTLPWILLLGDEQSGKSSLILNAEIDATELIKSSENTLNVYKTSVGIFFELPGQTLYDPSWKEFWIVCFEKLKSLRVLNRIDKIAIVLNLSRLMPLSPPQNEKAMQWISGVMSEIDSVSVQPIDVTVIFTHLDLLAGCREYFADSNCGQRYQPFGFSLEPSTSHTILTEQFQAHYEYLLKQTQQRVLALLHESNPDDDYNLAQDFPIQLGCIETLIKTCVLTIWQNMPHHLPLTGMYFVANRFQGVAIDNISSAINRVFKLPRNETAPQKRQAKAFFSHDLLETILMHFPMKSTRALAIQQLRRNVSSSLVMISLMLFTGLMIWQFRSNTHIINSAETAIANYQANEIDNTYSGLEELAIANRNLSHMNPILVRMLPNIHALKNNVNTLYRKALVSSLLNTQSREIEIALTSRTTDLQSKYALLNMYLLLHQPALRNARPFAAALNHYWEDQNLPPNVAKHLQQHFIFIKENQLTASIYDPIIVQQTREQLKDLPLPALAYTLLKSERMAMPSIEIDPHTTTLFSLTRHSIPYHYQQNAIANFDQSMQIITNRLRLGDPILGKQHFPNESFRGLDTQVLSIYLNDYANWWKILTYRAHPELYQSANDAEQHLKGFASTEHGFNALINYIKLNTSPIKATVPHAQLFNNIVAEPFTSITRLQPSLIDTMQLALLDANRIMEKIANNTYTSENLISLIQTQMQNTDANHPFNQLFYQAKGLPTPIREWYQAIALNNWFIVMKETQQSINTQWAQRIYPFYQEKIAGKYPFNPYSEDGVSIQDFTLFFGPGGMLDSFFKNNFSTFIDTRTAKWELKPFFGFKLEVSDEFIQQLERAQIIRDMYFDNRKRLSVRFRIKPIMLANGVKNITFDFSGQRAFYYPGSQKLTEITWPNERINFAQMTLQFENDGVISVSKHGPWAVFQLLQQLQLEQDSSVSHYRFTAGSHGDAMFSLVTEQLINPFIGHITEKFSLPEIAISPEDKTVSQPSSENTNISNNPNSLNNPTDLSNTTSAQNLSQNSGDKPYVPEVVLPNLPLENQRYLAAANANSNGNLYASGNTSNNNNETYNNNSNSNTNSNAYGYSNSNTYTNSRTNEYDVNQAYERAQAIERAKAYERALMAQSASSSFDRTFPSDRLGAPERGQLVQRIAPVPKSTTTENSGSTVTPPVNNTENKNTTNVKNSDLL